MTKDKVRARRRGTATDFRTGLVFASDGLDRKSVAVPVPAGFGFSGTGTYFRGALARPSLGYGRK